MATDRRQALFERLFTALVIDRARDPDFMDSARGENITRDVRARRIKQCFEVATQAVDLALPATSPVPPDLYSAGAALAIFCNSIDPKSPELQALISRLESAMMKAKAP
jgi:hypothetical protein